MLITELCKAFGAVNVLGHIRQPVMDLFNIGPIGDGYQFANKLRAGVSKQAQAFVTAKTKPAMKPQAYPASCRHVFGIK